MTATTSSPTSALLADTAALAAEIQDRGYAILEGLLPPELIEEWHQSFRRIWAAVQGGNPPTNRGPARWYLDLPFAPPFSDAQVHAHPAILAVVEALLGTDPLLLHLGTDTPAPGSDFQDVHSDLPPLFPEQSLVTPIYALAVNIPLVDVTADNGPFEAAVGSHRLALPDGMQRLASGELRLEPVHLRRGDVMIRDPRMLHRGTPNRGTQPRPVVVLAFHRPWLRHGSFEPIAISSTMCSTLGERSRRLLRLHLDHARCV